MLHWAVIVIIVVVSGQEQLKDAVKVVAVVHCAVQLQLTSSEHFTSVYCHLTAVKLVNSQY